MPDLALLALDAYDGTIVVTSIVLVFVMLIVLCLLSALFIFSIMKKLENATAA